MTELVAESSYRWRIDPAGGTRGGGIVYSARNLLPDPTADSSLGHVANVAVLPGVAEVCGRVGVARTGAVLRPAAAVKG